MVSNFIVLARLATRALGMAARSRSWSRSSEGEQIVGDDTQAHPPPHPTRPSVPTSPQPMTTFERTDAPFTASAPAERRTGGARALFPRLARQHDMPNPAVARRALMRLQAERAPDAAHRRPTESAALRHRARAPLGGVRRHMFQGQSTSSVFNHDHLKRAGVAHEFVFVEWNAVSGRPFLAEILGRELPWWHRRFVVGRWHERLSLNPFLVFMEFFAKNVGLRRAGGRFVLTTITNIWLSRDVLRTLRRVVPGTLYRAVRVDLRREIAILRECPVGGALRMRNRDGGVLGVARRTALAGTRVHVGGHRCVGLGVLSGQPALAPRRPPRLGLVASEGCSSIGYTRLTAHSGQPSRSQLE
jgi:hypothetical protein